MCIAIASPIGTEIPSESYLKNSWHSNPDGAGIAFNIEGKVKIIKGLMSWEAFKTTLKSLDEKYDLKNRGVLIHFRIATAGGINKDATHPFPVSSDYNIMKKPEQFCKYALIHNGIISNLSCVDGDISAYTHVSDTMSFNAHIISSLASNKNWMDNDKNMEIIYSLAKSKFAFIDSDGSVKMTSGFTKDEDGNYYSNESYLVDYRWYEEKYYDMYYDFGPSEDDNYDDWSGYTDYSGWGKSKKESVTEKSDADTSVNPYYSCSTYTALTKLKPDEVLKLEDGTVVSLLDSESDCFLWFDPETRDAYKGDFKYAYSTAELKTKARYLGKATLYKEDKNSETLCLIQVPYVEYSTRLKDFFITKKELTELYGIKFY